eukprot:4844816-Pleurochrysis_carterae.AAC.1
MATLPPKCACVCACVLAYRRAGARAPAPKALPPSTVALRASMLRRTPTSSRSRHAPSPRALPFPLSLSPLQARARSPAHLRARARAHTTWSPHAHPPIRHHARATTAGPLRREGPYIRFGCCGQHTRGLAMPASFSALSATLSVILPHRSVFVQRAAAQSYHFVQRAAAQSYQCWPPWGLCGATATGDRESQNERLRAPGEGARERAGKRTK